jgi:hypothetical protein
MTEEDRKTIGTSFASIRNRAVLLNIVLQDGSMRMENPKKMTLSSGKPSRKAHQHILLQHLIPASQVRRKGILLLRPQTDTVDIDQNGGYLTDCQVHMENCLPHAKDKDAAARLWTLSEAIVGQEFPHGDTSRL